MRKKIEKKKEMQEKEEEDKRDVDNGEREFVVKKMRSETR